MEDLGTACCSGTGGAGGKGGAGEAFGLGPQPGRGDGVARPARRPDRGRGPRLDFTATLREVLEVMIAGLLARSPR
jgi:hypothetical protein